ncbi:MAG: sulfotransferase [Candidatus Aminicenantes bacterium]|nr:sulfotransferase [Candidatus Aminicenantes bacterium]
MKLRTADDKPVLIEKLPINNFRLNLILRIFPDARFIHIYRNGLEVARSMDGKKGLTRRCVEIGHPNRGKKRA